MKQRILLVDDDLTVLLTLKAVLELNHFEVDTASSAAEALKCLKSRTYQLVISDSHMEHKDAGLTVIRAAKAQSYAPATAMFSAEPPDGHDWRGGEAESFLVKPIGTEELVRHIQQMLSSRAQAQAARAAQPAGERGAASTAMAGSSSFERRKAS
ncbi:MAG: response regulator [Acidobacteriales bacterium]|nr:response regulator [Terriglobales bacterium]